MVEWNGLTEMNDFQHIFRQEETSMTEKRITRSRAIRLKCLDCCCGNSAEVRRCELTKCPLWRYRMGSESKAYTAQKQGNDLGV